MSDSKFYKAIEEAISHISKVSDPNAKKALEKICEALLQKRTIDGGLFNEPEV